MDLEKKVYILLLTNYSHEKLLFFRYEEAQLPKWST
jgi:hypothetical protein